MGENLMQSETNSASLADCRAGFGRGGERAEALSARERWGLPLDAVEPVHYFVQLEPLIFGASTSGDESAQDHPFVLVQRRSSVDGFRLF
jgi:hypothetical protein